MECNGMTTTKMQLQCNKKASVFEVQIKLPYLYSLGGPRSGPNGSVGAQPRHGSGCARDEELLAALTPPPNLWIYYVKP